MNQRPMDIQSTEEADTIFPGTGRMRVWAAENPNKVCGTYNISTMDSVTRIATYIGMITTHEVGTVYSNGDGMANNIHMLSTAMGAQFSLMFLQTNISLAS